MLSVLCVSHACLEHINQMCVERKRSQTVSAGSPVTPGRKMPRLPTVRRSNKPPLSQTSADGSGSTPPLAGGKRRGIHFPKRKISSTDQSPMDESPTSLPSSISEESSTTVTDGKHGKAKGFLAEIKRKQSSNKVELSPNIERSSPGNNVSGDELEDEPAEKLPLLDHETAMCMQFAVTYSVKDGESSRCVVVLIETVLSTRPFCLFVREVTGVQHACLSERLASCSVLNF